MKLYMSLALVALIGLPVPQVLAEGSRGINPPPLVLSPNLAEPWLLQLRPEGQPRPAPMVVGEPVAQPPVRLASAGSPQAAAAVRRQVAPQFLPAVVDYTGPHKPGTIIIDTNARYLYLVEQNGVARRYGVGVGKPGFEWAGAHKVTRKAEWPDWRPPAEMRKRRPDLPTFMAGGPNNPLGARALYLGSTLYRIHGSNEPWSIGHAVSSGCIRMRNEDVTDLYERVGVGTKVIVM
ncbi:L,D-transpeptidase [Pannonibacter carbonis]|uniref:L,D-transpeptidase n=1 Tax=Pannonibacter carbonis TaxID=2067569 RepID=UPI000D0E3822|nr:L,D-transpeptidase [Pannonibacter carbonis]